MMQALVNCAGSALLASNFRVKCIPAAISVLVGKDGFLVDPTIEQISSRLDFSHKCFTVVDADKEEYLYSTLQPLGWHKETKAGATAANAGALTFSAIQKVMGVTLSAGKAVHEHILE